MPIASLNARILKRSAGRSSVQFASYQSGETLIDERAGATRLSPRKRGEDLRHTEIVTPDHAPAWMLDRSRLWNGVEHKERRKDAQLARCFIGAVPRELPLEWQTALVRQFAKEQFADAGMVCDFALHNAKASDGLDQPHAHMLVTMREIEGEGFGKKNRAWNDRSLMGVWRSEWERTVNEYLEDYGRDERIDMRSYKARGIDRVPLKHLSYQQGRLERAGRETAPGDHNRMARHRNRVAGINYQVAPEQVIQLEEFDREIEYESARPLERGEKARGLER